MGYLNHALNSGELYGGHPFTAFYRQDFGTENIYDSMPNLPKNQAYPQIPNVNPDMDMNSDFNMNS